MLLMHSTKWSQEVARGRPQSLNGVGVNFTHTITVVVSRPLLLTVADRVMCSLDLVVALPLIRVTTGSALRKLMHMLLQSLTIRMLVHSQAALPTRSADGSHHWWSIIVIGAVPTPLVRSTTRRIKRIGVLFAFFPPRSETSRRFQSRSLVVRSDPESHERCVGVACASDARSDVTTLTPVKALSLVRLCTHRVITRPLGADQAYSQRRWCPCKGCRRADNVGSDDRPDHACESETVVPARLWHHTQNISDRVGESISSPTQDSLVRPIARLSGRSFPKFNMHQLVT